MHLVVGLDGSPASERALRWAFAAAAEPDDVVEAVLIVEPPGVMQAETQETVALREHAEQRGMERLNGHIASALPEGSRKHVRRTVRSGRPGRWLPAIADGSDGLVIGSRGVGGFKGLLLGSVSRYVLNRASVPVIVVPARGTEKRPGGRVVVGTDGSHEAGWALRWAAGTVRRHGGALEVVTVVRPSGGSEEPPGDAGERARERLDAEIAEWLGDHADLDLTAEVRHGHPTEQLLDAGNGADLIVVGTRGTGGVRQALGSVSYQVSNHATCPVAVVP